MSARIGKPVRRASYAVNEVAQAHGIHRTTVWRWIKSGKVRTISSPGGRTRIPADEFDRIAGGAA